VLPGYKVRPPWIGTQMTVPPRSRCRLRKQRQRQMERAGKRTYRLVRGTSVLTSSFRGQQRTRYAQAEFFASLPISVVQRFNLAVMHKSVRRGVVVWGLALRRRMKRREFITLLSCAAAASSSVSCGRCPARSSRKRSRAFRQNRPRPGGAHHYRPPRKAISWGGEGPKAISWGGEGPDTFVFKSPLAVDYIPRVSPIHRCPALERG
jgi:hypothetical protein